MTAGNHSAGVYPLEGGRVSMWILSSWQTEGLWADFCQFIQVSLSARCGAGRTNKPFGDRSCLVVLRVHLACKLDR